MVARSELRGNDWYVELAALVGLMVLAGVGHIVLLVAFLVLPNLFSGWVPTPPQEEVYQVSLIALPHTDDAMAQMDVRVESAPTPVDVDAAEPVTDPGRADEGTSEPEDTPNPSDLEFQTPDAKVAKGDPRPDNTKARADRIRALERQARLAALGNTQSTAGDPDSTSDQRIDLGGSGIMDAELARYENECRQKVMAGFNPLPTLAGSNPGLVSQIVIRFDLDTGVVQSWSWAKRSGNPSWDGAAERAADAVRRLPTPPAKHRGRYVDGFRLNFNASDY